MAALVSCVTDRQIPESLKLKAVAGTDGNTDRRERKGANGENFYGTFTEAEGYHEVLSSFSDLFKDEPGKFIDLPPSR